MDLIPPTLNYWSILAAAVASMVLGFIYYSPAVLGKPWMALMNLNAKKSAQMKKGMGQIFVLMFLSLLITAYILSVFIHLAGAQTMMEGVIVGVVAWFGFAATTALASAMYTKKPFKLYLIDTGYNATSFAIMGALLIAWP